MTTASNSNVTIFLLMENPSAAQEISSIFRQIGIIPEFFLDLKSFWKALLDELPALAIVDVRKMSEERLVLKEHPRVKDESCSLAFFHNEKSHPLLRAAFDIGHLGLIEEGPLLMSSLKAVLSRINKLNASSYKLELLEGKVVQAQAEQKKLMEEVRNYKRKETAQGVLDQLILSLGKFKANDSGDFYQVCEKVLGGWEDILFFSYLELGAKGQRLLSPDSPFPKYKKIPHLWLTKPCVEGMEFFAQNLALEMAVDELGDDCIPIPIYGEFKRPNVMLFLKVRPEMVKDLSWKVLETVLSGIYYRAIALRPSLKSELWPEITPWELLGEVDDFFYQAKDFSKQLINVDFSPLIKSVVQLSFHRFDWKNFYRDFLGQVRNMASFDFKVTSFGVEQLAFLVEPTHGDLMIKHLKNLLQQFKYVNYFEGDIPISLGKLLPEVRRVPLSSHSYLRMAGQMQSEERPTERGRSGRTLKEMRLAD